MDQLRAAGDASWFEPAIELIDDVRADPDERARHFLDLENALVVARAPGRLDVMGGIADYSGATVLQLPLDRATVCVLQRQSAPRCDVITRRGSRWQSFEIGLDALLSELGDPETLAAWFQTRRKDHWAAYVLGAVQFCLQRSNDLENNDQPGLRLLIDSSVPEGKGVSSSAAIEVATLSAVSASYRVELTSDQVATACQWVENHVVGAPCGIMDQMTSACGRGDRLLRLRCQPAMIEGHLEIPHGYRFFGIDSGVRHAVTGADYGTVRTAAFMGYRLIADFAGFDVATDGGRVRVKDPLWHGYLANLTVAEFSSRFESRLPESMLGGEFLRRYAGTTDAVTRVSPDRRYPVRVATAHPVYEQRRILRFAELLKRLVDERDGDDIARELGLAMFQSHESYTACGLGSDATDRLVRLARTAGPDRGVFGAKITGGGSGGTVAILAASDAADIIRDIATAYSAETGRAAEVFDASGPGAGELGTLILEHS